MLVQVRMIRDGLLIGSAIRANGEVLTTNRWLAERLVRERAAELLVIPVADDEDGPSIQTIETATLPSPPRNASTRRVNA